MDGCATRPQPDAMRRKKANFLSPPSFFLQTFSRLVPTKIESQGEIAFSRCATFAPLRLGIDTSPRVKSIIPAADRCQEHKNGREGERPAELSLRTTGKSPEKCKTSLFRSKNESTVMIKNIPPVPRPPSGQDARRRRFLSHECQFEVVDDPVHRGIIGDEGDDLHRSPGNADAG